MSASIAFLKYVYNISHIYPFVICDLDLLHSFVVTSICVDNLTKGEQTNLKKTNKVLMRFQLLIPPTKHDKALSNQRNREILCIKYTKFSYKS